MPKAKIDYVTGPPSQRMRAAINAVAEGLLAALTFWHQTKMPEHFTKAGAIKYGYQPRSGEGEPAMVYSHNGLGREVVRRGVSRRLINNPKYFWRKKREGYGDDPLVRTGETEREAKAGIRLSTRKSVGDGIVRGTGAMNVPTYFYQRIKAGTYARGDRQFTLLHDTPDKYKELTAITEEEAQEMKQIVSQTAMAKLLAPQAPRSAALA